MTCIGKFQLRFQFFIKVFTKVMTSHALSVSVDGRRTFFSLYYYEYIECIARLSKRLCIKRALSSLCCVSMA
jgi:hypothetical protein